MLYTKHFTVLYACLERTLFFAKVGTGCAQQVEHSKRSPWFVRSKNQKCHPLTMFCLPKKEADDVCWPYVVFVDDGDVSNSPTCRTEKNTLPCVELEGDRWAFARRFFA